MSCSSPSILLDHDETRDRDTTMNCLPISRAERRELFQEWLHSEMKVTFIEWVMVRRTALPLNEWEGVLKTALEAKWSNVKDKATASETPSHQ